MDRRSLLANRHTVLDPRSDIHDLPTHSLLASRKERCPEVEQRLRVHLSDISHLPIPSTVILLGERVRHHAS